LTFMHAYLNFYNTGQSQIVNKQMHAVDDSQPR